MKALRGHVSPETAYVVEDYPYGFRLRCKKRYWIERTKNGERICEQTSNPKKAGEVWNKPKKSTYVDIMFLMIAEDTGYVTSGGFSIEWGDLAKLEALIAQVELDLSDKYYADLLHKMKVVEEARKHIKVEIVPVRADEERQTQEEKNRLVSKVLAYSEAVVNGEI